MHLHLYTFSVTEFVAHAFVVQSMLVDFPNMAVVASQEHSGPCGIQESERKKSEHKKIYEVALQD